MFRIGSSLPSSSYVLKAFPTSATSFIGATTLPLKDSRHLIGSQGVALGRQSSVDGADAVYAVQPQMLPGIRSATALLICATRFVILGVMV